jgi:hypothetical protein
MLYSGIFPRGETETIPNNVYVRLNNQTSKCISRIQCWPMRDRLIGHYDVRLSTTHRMYRIHHVLFFNMYIYTLFCELY